MCSSDLELQQHEEDDSGDEDERCLEAMQAQLPRAVESIVARKIGEATAPLETKLREVEGGTARLELERDEAKKECDGAINDLADLEERLFGAESRLKAAEAAAVNRQEAEELADADVVQALVQERDLLKEKVRELDEAPQKWEARLAQLDAELKEASTQRDAAGADIGRRVAASKKKSVTAAAEALLEVCVGSAKTGGSTRRGPRRSPHRLHREVTLGDTDPGPQRGVRHGPARDGEQRRRGHRGARGAAEAGADRRSIGACRRGRGGRPASSAENGTA